MSTTPEVYTCTKWAVQQTREQCADLVASCTDLLSEETAAKIASRIRALNHPLYDGLDPLVARDRAILFGRDLVAITETLQRLGRAGEA